MRHNEIISPTEAASLKNVTTACIYQAIRKNRIDSLRLSPRVVVIQNNARFRDWKPDRVKQKAKLGKTKHRKVRLPNGKQAFLGIDVGAGKDEGRVSR